MAKKGYIVMENGEKIEFDLFPNEAPKTVENFENLANQAFMMELLSPSYPWLCIAKVEILTGTGTGGPGYTIKCETEGNPHKHEAGSLSMAHAGRDTGGSQFFIVHEPQPHLNGVHTVFGKVTSGLDTALEMQNGDIMDKVRSI